MAEMPNIHPGKRVRSLFGETDTDGEAERHIPAGSWGHITDRSGDHWAVTFDAGGRVLVTESEMLNQAQYRLAAPETVEQLALALQYGQDVLELTYLDETLMPFTETLAGNPGEILEALRVARGER